MARQTYEVTITGRFTLIGDEDYPADQETATYVAETFLGIGEFDTDSGCPNYVDLQTTSIRVDPAPAPPAAEAEEA